MTQVWIKNENIENEDVWDDTELIKMYESSISSKYEEVKTSVKSQKWTTPEGNKYNWKVGSKCMAPFQEDEEAEIEYFPARIDWIGGENDPKVRVTFDGYGNQETVHIKDLWEEHEIGDEDEEEEEKEEEADNNDIVMRSPTKNQKIKKPKKKNDPNSQSSTAGISKIPVLAPPPPPGILNMVPPDEVEALSSMLMSWYMSGYHTGYYQAISDQKRANSSQKK